MANPLLTFTDAVSYRLNRVSLRRRPAPVAAETNVAALATPATAPAAPVEAPRADAELIVQRDRLIEKFTIMQSDLGGAFYEMAIRDHVRIDVLTRKAAELQAVDSELSQVERSIELQRSGIAGNCSNCNAPYGPGVAFCSQCGHTLMRWEQPATNGAAL